jgi:hypothetical protein
MVRVVARRIPTQEAARSLTPRPVGDPPGVEDRGGAVEEDDPVDHQDRDERLGLDCQPGQGRRVGPDGQGRDRDRRKDDGRRRQEDTAPDGAGPGLAQARQEEGERGRHHGRAPDGHRSAHRASQVMLHAL